MNDDRRSHGFPLIRWDVVRVGEREQQMVSIIREKGRDFACAADTREKAWEGLVRLMAQSMDAHFGQTGLDPGDALTHPPPARLRNALEAIRQSYPQTGRWPEDV